MSKLFYNLDAHDDVAQPSDIPYKRNTTSTLVDRAFNVVSLTGATYDLSAALDEVSPAEENSPRDLLLIVTATAATTITYTAGSIKGDAPTVGGSGTWIIALTEYLPNTWYCRQKKMEDAT